MNNGQLVIPKVWRSEVGRVVVYILLCGACVWVSLRFPGSIISGKLFSLFGRDLYLHLPLFWLLPASSLLELASKIYNVSYSIDQQGITSRVGIVALKQSVTRIRFEDIRSIETEQTVIERLLNVGDVEVGTAATGAVEVILDGVLAPREVRELIQAERDKRVKLSAKKGLRFSEAERVLKAI